ncbi:sugar transferase [Desulfobacula phenolica]|uniref:Exopolysaccharide biosynthesis polyprenyl glycosylphosphotransferase n=1 Tax=Desulfobacula phenolica TaxID=90732 RepID=A0A1H2DU30_9BACT|nr:sugar transferase [Desulfobacula phenolica]SDT86362.1 exopolysaccharide biosynthesis polyprenyl glycosylphosphotransferase [Desulfobacula phenolica]
MFKDQKEYVRLTQITSDFISLLILYFLIIPVLTFFLKSLPFFSALASKSFFYKNFLYIQFSPLIVLFPPVFIYFSNCYKTKYLFSLKTISYQSILLCLITTTLLLLPFKKMGFTFIVNLTFCLLSATVLWLILAFNRFLIKHTITHETSHKNIIKHILLVGVGPNALEIADHINQHPEKGLRIVGFLSEQQNDIGKIISGKPVLGLVNNLSEITLAHYSDYILCTTTLNSKATLDFVSTTCATIGLNFATTELELHHKYIEPFTINHLESIGSIQIKIFKFIYRTPKYIFFKRCFDFSGSSLLISLCLPFWIVIAIAIKLSSPGPVLFRQERIGKYGKKFILFKFRTMVKGAEKIQHELMHLNEMNGPAFKIKNDPRQTITGKLLRRTSLDELPQLFNVFRGDISLVGPRPAIEREVHLYRPWERKRLSVVQGITCIWQVSGRNNIKFDEWMKLDLMYIENWSIPLDLIILMKTIPAVIFKNGAY